LVLAAVGGFRGISDTVAQSPREIGLRMGLGAKDADVLRLIVGEDLTLAFLGISGGGGGALAFTPLIVWLCFGVTATDSTTFIGVPALLLLVALLACFFPARRATRIDPMVALRYE